MEANALQAEAQEIFTTVVQHLRKQGKRSNSFKNGVERCLYRSPEGLKCAVGCLIPDDEYQEWMDKLLLAEVINGLKSSLKEKMQRHDHMLVVLQITHDAFVPEKWEERFAAIATSFKLTVPEKEAT